MARAVEFNEKEAIQKAMNVFWEKGYNGASLRDLTDAMKINSSSLYNTIGDKHALFVRCLEHYIELRKELLLKLAAEAKSPLKAVVKYLQEAVKVIASEANSCLAVKTAFEVGSHDDRVKAILKKDNTFSHDYLSSLITQAIEQGELPKDEDPDLLADHIISTYTGWYELYILHKDPVRIKRMAQYLIRKITT
jgi:TetR/AcrR family transcriptional regulator, transcriptional repressor for nem operon